MARQRTTEGALVLAFIGALSTSCSSEPRSDGPSTDEPLADADEGRDGVDHPSTPDAEAQPDGGDHLVPPRPGAVTLVMNGAEVITERICDMNGDGVGDNAVADLGSPAGELLAGIFDSLFAGEIADGSRSCAHFPWLDDVANADDADAVLIFFHASDTDQPIDPDDDFSGSEPFEVWDDSVDRCGEPLFHFESVRLEGGELSGEDGLMPILIRGSPPWRGARLFGTLEPGGGAAEITMCGYAPASELGESPGITPELNLLEVLLGGGAPHGAPSISGLTLDLDLDGDGLETFETDADGRIVRCADGDDTVVDGPACWLDPRIADGLSLSMSVTGLAAVYGGFTPGAEARMTEECPEGPPSPSLWDSPSDAP